MSLLLELRRRNVFRVGVAYLVAAWLLLQVTELLVPILGLPDWASGLVFLLLAIGFVPALIFAWAFELTPEGVKRERDIDRSASITKLTGRKIDFAIIAMMAVAILYLIVDNYVLEEVPVGPDAVARSVAVLPFRNRSSLAEDAFFVDGIQDDLLTQLARLSALDKVISRTSTERYRETTLPIPQIGEELGVATILEGGIQRAGDHVRINVQLIDTRTDEHMWAATYDRELTVENLFEIQTDITREIIAALHGVLSSDEDKALQTTPTSNFEAYKRYTLGRTELAKRTRDSLARAKSHFEEAIRLDADYALAYVGLADVYALQPEHAGVRRKDTEIPRQEALDRALAINPTSGEAYANLASLKRWLGETEKAEEYFLRAIQLSPNYPTAYHWYAVFLRINGRLDEAVVQIRKAIELDPMSPVLATVYSGTLASLGRPEEAESIARTGIERNPEYADYYWDMGLLLKQEGRLAEALRWARKSAELNPSGLGNVHLVCDLLMQLADFNEAEQCFDELKAAFPHSPVFDKALLYAYRRLFDEAIELLEEIDPQDRRQDNPIFRAHIYLSVGRSDKAMTVLVEHFPELAGNEDVKVDLTSVTSAIYVAIALYENDMKARADYLFDKSLEVLHALHRTRGNPVGLRDVAIHAVRNDEEAAIAALRDAYDMGWRLNSTGLRLPPFDTMLNNPEWVEIVELFENDIARQRQWYDEHKDDPLL